MAPKKRPESSRRNLWIATGLSVLMLAAGMLLIDTVDGVHLYRRLAIPLGRLLLFIVVGLALGQVIEASGWTGKLGAVAGPLFRFAGLGPRCSAAFITAFVSGAAANAMLYDYWRESKIDKRQLFLTNLANQLPAFFLHLPTTVFIVLPLTGRAGVLYFLITFVAALIRFVLVLVYGRLRPSTVPDVIAAGPGDLAPVQGKKEGIAGIGRILKTKLPRRIANIATFVVPIYIAVFLLQSAGMFDWLRQWIAQWVTTAFIPIEALSLVVLSFAAEFTSGFAAAGALMNAGVITIKQTVLALLIGNVVAFPVRALRHQLPRLMGIFAPKMGLQLMLLGQSIRIVSLVLVGWAYYMVW